MPAAPGPSDTSLTSILARGLHAVAVSNLPLAQRCLQQAKARPPRQLWQQGAAPMLLEAQCAVLEGRAGEAVRLLRPVAAPPIEVPYGEYGIGLTWVRWSLADAFERLGQPDSAAACLERQMLYPQETPLWPLVHRRLALLYAKIGRLPDAERHLAALEQTWDRPDPEVRRMLDEARAAVAAARGMSRPARPPG